MRYAPLLSFALLALSGCVAPVPTSTTYVTPATTTTYTTPATRTDRHERAAWLSTGLRGTPTYHYGNSYPLVAMRTAQVPEYFSFLSSFLFNMGEAGSRVETLPQAGNPYAPETEEHERWWAEIAERSVSNDRPAVDD